MIITANKWFKAEFKTYLEMVIKAAMAKQGITVMGEAGEDILIAYVNRDR